MNTDLAITAFKDFKEAVEKMDNRGLFERFYDSVSFWLFGNQKNICRY